jgi:hypothetical protein
MIYLLLPLAANAGELVLQYEGTPPFTLSATRLGEPKPVFDFTTDKSREVDEVDYQAVPRIKQ